MKIVSWNCNGKFRVKFREISKIDADIYIIQECEDSELIADKEYQNFAVNYRWMGRDKNKGLGVFAKSNIKMSDLNWNPLCLKFFIPLRINDSFDLLALWTQRPYIEEYYIYQALNISHFSKQLVIFGDFNSNQQFDKKYVTRKERGHMCMVNELKAFGLESAYHYLTNEEQGKEKQSTFYLYHHKDRGYHIDHCFLDLEQLTDYKVLDSDNWLSLSDHVPCVLEIKY